MLKNHLHVCAFDIVCHHEFTTDNKNSEFESSFCYYSVFAKNHLRDSAFDNVCHHEFTRDNICSNNLNHHKLSDVLR